MVTRLWQRRSLRLISIVCLPLLHAAPIQVSCIADETHIGTTEKTEIELASLPAAPESINQLIRRSDVRLVTGGQPNSNPDLLPASVTVAGETRFTFRYRYESRVRWQVLGKASASTEDQVQQVQLRVRFRSVDWIASHEIWLKHLPDATSFWKDRVVNHEFDHVRISSDPRIAKKFLESVREIESMRVPLTEVKGSDGRVSNSKVQQLVESRMKQAVEQISDYVRVRYGELDRITRHGLMPIPADAELPR